MLKISQKINTMLAYQFHVCFVQMQDLLTLVVQDELRDGSVHVVPVVFVFLLWGMWCEPKRCVTLCFLVIRELVWK